MTPIKIEEQFNLNGAKYHVQGLILHQGGSIHHGHYVTYLKHGGSWTLHDDDKPTQSAEFQEINNRQQYIIIARKAEKDGHQFVTPSTKRRAQPLAQLESEECQLCINSTQHHCQMCKQPVCNFHSVPYDDTESHRVHPQCQTQKSLSGRSSSESLYDSECEGKKTPDAKKLKRQQTTPHAPDKDKRSAQQKQVEVSEDEQDARMIELKTKSTKRTEEETSELIDILRAKHEQLKNKGKQKTDQDKKEFKSLTEQLSRLKKGSAYHAADQARKAAERSNMTPEKRTEKPYRSVESFEKRLSILCC